MKPFTFQTVATLTEKGFSYNPYTGNYDREEKVNGNDLSTCVFYDEETGDFGIQKLVNYDFDSEVYYPSNNELLIAINQL